ncbi:hypothetical protein [Saccharothrix sp.]|uniref:hypothetical protein n=1 Tax=Saccharothrix sp. TaxID=1873460 RepID=UPI0028126DF4|nr:hypothetical protein [Saccharothrix sp.]
MRGFVFTPRYACTLCTGLYEWVHSNGGEDEGASSGRFSLYSMHEIIHILSARIVVVEKLSPKSGASTFCGQGSPVEVRHLAITVNETTQKIEYRPDGATGKIAPFTFEIKPDDVEMFQFKALGGGVK